jgi:class 3 adenylate cyclase
MGHVLFMDIVAYSKMPMDQQCKLVAMLQEAVRQNPTFLHAQEKNRLIRLPTGDGMALVFFQNPEYPVRCAVELSQTLRQHPEIKLRMGIHTGPVYRVDDINAASNVAGGGINMAQRVMDCGDAGHILVSQVVADMLVQMGKWDKCVHDLGEAEVKHGVRVHIFSLYTDDDAGNPELPQKSRAAHEAALLREQERARRALRRARGVAAILGLAFVIALGLAIYAFFEHSTAIVQTREARLFVGAMQAQTAVQRAENVQLEKAAALQRDTDAKKDRATLDRDKQELEMARKSVQELSAAAARKSGQAFALIGAVRIIGTNQISPSDLFDVSSGGQVSASSPARNMTDMFSGGQGSAERATVFVDGQPVGSTHWIEWRTKDEVTVKSVALFAAHDQVRFRRAFSNFKLLAKKQNKWVELAQYAPSLPYGGSCASEPCLPPAVKFQPGTVLAACVNVNTPVAADEFRAEFEQAVSALEVFSGPRVLQLDGYSKPDCSN